MRYTVIHFYPDTLEGVRRRQASKDPMSLRLVVDLY